MEGKYKCYRCEAVFKQSDAVVRDDGCYEEFWGARVWMPYKVDTCPECGSDELEEYEDKEEDKNND